MYIIFILLFVLPPVALFGARNFKNLYILLASSQHLPTQKKCLTSHPNVVDHQDRSRSLNFSDSLL